MKRKEWLFLTLIFLLIFAIESVATHNLFTVHHLGANDFYSRWAGAHALLVTDRDPYSLEVTAEIQIAKGLDPALEGKGSFAYPLHVIFLFWPLVYLSYPWAQALWMVTLQWLVVFIAVLLFMLSKWKPSPLAGTAMILSTILLYPVSRSIILGQFTLHVTLFLAATLLALQNRRDGWAGFFLALTSVKPQMIILIGSWLALWAIVQRRWHFIKGLLAGGAGMFLASLFLFPSWLISFIEDIQRYSKVAGGRNPLVVLIDQLLPGAGEFIPLILRVILILAMLWSWWYGLQDEQVGTETTTPFWQATYWTIIVNLLVFFQTGTTNQTLLLIPLFGWLAQLRKRPAGRWAVITIMMILLLFPWILFLTTIEGDAEHVILFWPLPLLALMVLIGNQRISIS